VVAAVAPFLGAQQTYPEEEENSVRDLEGPSQEEDPSPVETCPEVEGQYREVPCPEVEGQYREVPCPEVDPFPEEVPYRAEEAEWYSRRSVPCPFFFLWLQIK